MAFLPPDARLGCMIYSYRVQSGTLRIGPRNRKKRQEAMARYTLIVGTRNWSSWSLRPFIALKAVGVPFKTVDIRLRQTDAPSTREQILQHSPAGKVPVLKIVEGKETLTLWDSL